MKFVAALLVSLLLIADATAVTREERGNLILENIPAPDAERAATLDAYLDGRNASFVDWLPDGSMLVSTRFGDTAQLHRVRQPLGSREQITFDTEPITAASAPQTGGAPGFVFLRDQGGNENAQIFYRDLTTRTTRRLTDGQSRNASAVWSRDGRRVAYTSTARDGVSYDLYIADVLENAAPRFVMNGMSKTWFALDWSVDDSKLLVLNYRSINESYLFIADAITGSLTPVDAGNNRVGIRAARFAPDGRYIYLISDRDSEFARLRRVDTVLDEVAILTERIPWDIASFDVSPDGRYVAFVANVDGYSRLTILDQINQSEISPPLADVQISNLAFDRTGKRLALSVESALEPRDVYVLEVEKNALERWTQSETGAVDSRRFVPAELVRYASFDRANGKQREIPAFVFRPSTPGPHPVVIELHGGPEAQYTPGHSPFTQFLVNEIGAVVIAPNIRGSSGYGKSYLQLDNGMLREDAIKDIGSLLVWIGLQPDLDRERVVVMGGSYGGYLTLASLVHYSDRLRGGINTVGISNFITFLENTSAYRRDLRRAEYGDEREPRMRAFLRRISPLTNAERIQRPLLIVQGLNDPRVPASESAQMVGLLRARGGEVWYLAAKDEGHGFRKKANRDIYLETVSTFLTTILKTKPAPNAPPQ
ncbi:MAG: S9 family peptidase [Proteobacteria bacterium]|nr:S9 family peptidase [Pseudomonadota bacterium]